MTAEGAAAKRRRANGKGGIERDAARDRYRGHYRDASSERVRLPWCDNRVDAEEQLQAAMEMAAASGGLSVGGGTTLRSWGKAFLDRRELEGNRAAKHDRLRWRYLFKAHFIDWPVASITRRDVKRWMGELNLRKTYGRGRPQKSLKKKPTAPTKVLSWQTKTHALTCSVRRSCARATTRS